MALTEPSTTGGSNGSGGDRPANEESGPADSVQAGAGVPPALPVVRRRAFLGSRRRQVVASAVIAAAIAFLVVEGLGNATEYYKTVPQAIGARASLGTTHFRIMGTVDNDVHQVGNTTEFSITYERQTAHVVDSEQPPELFKPGIPVVLEGFWSGPNFHSDLIMIKHTAAYTPPTDPDVAHPNAAPSNPAPANQ